MFKIKIDRQFKLLCFKIIFLFEGLFQNGRSENAKGVVNNGSFDCSDIRVLLVRRQTLQ